MAHVIERKEPLGTWQHLLGDGFAFVRPHLVQCAGEHARNIVCPETGHSLAVRQVKERRVAYPAEDFEADADEVRELRDEDVQMWRIDRESVNARLRDALGVAGTEEWQVDGCALVGICRRCGGKRAAYVSWARDGEQALEHVEHVAAHCRRGGCMLLPRRFRGVGDALDRQGLGEVLLSDAFSIVAGRLTGDCGRACEDVGAADGKLDAIHDQVRRIGGNTDPLAVAIAEVKSEVGIVHRHVQGVPVIQAELAEARMVPEALALEIQSRIADILTPDQQQIWMAVRKAGTQKGAVALLSEAGVNLSEPTLSRRVNTIDAILEQNGLPPCKASGPNTRFLKSGGYVNRDGEAVPEELSAVEEDWAADESSRDTTIRSYLAARPEDRAYFEQTKPGITDEAEKYLKRHPMKSG